MIKQNISKNNGLILATMALWGEIGYGESYGSFKRFNGKTNELLSEG